MRLGRAVKIGARWTLAALCHATRRYEACLRGRVAILAYHRVLPDSQVDPLLVQPGMYVRTQVFEQQMRFVRDAFEVLSLAQLFDLWNERGLDPAKRYCVVTFDDGWRDNYQHAFPVLRRLAVPATIFLPTEYIGTDDWFWPDRLAHLLSRGGGPALRLALNGHQRSVPGRSAARCGGADVDRVIEEWKRLPQDTIQARLERISRETGVAPPAGRVLMSWEEVREMERAGLTFGSHSRTHRILTGLSASERDDEIQGSLATLRERTNGHVPVFCYPNGDHDAQIRRSVQAAGYIGAVTTDCALAGPMPRDRFALARISLHDDISSTLPMFTLRLTGRERLLSRRG